MHDGGAGYGEGVPGVGVWWVGGGRGYTGTHPYPPMDPYLVIFSHKMPTYGQMKAILEVPMRFLRI